MNDKSGRYMSKSVRPDIDPAVAAGWLDNVAALFTDRLGVQVAPDQVKSSATKAPEPKAGETDNRSASVFCDATSARRRRRLVADRVGRRPDEDGVRPVRSAGTRRSPRGTRPARRAAPLDRVPARDPGRRGTGAPPGRRPLGGSGAPNGEARRPRRGGRDPPTPDQAAFAALTGALPLGDLTLTLAQRYRLLRRWGDRDDLLTETAAGTAARDLGIALTLITDDGTVRRFEP
ncbi:hypothetical protein [Streptomyces mirabilis]|uniref:hypothetical protein n=1 Tax=Streptomyces mirabilis TaxID=68239 RepID=UPI0036E530C8